MCPQALPRAGSRSAGCLGGSFLLFMEHGHILAGGGTDQGLEYGGEVQRILKTDGIGDFLHRGRVFGHQGACLADAKLRQVFLRRGGDVLLEQAVQLAAADAHMGCDVRDGDAGGVVSGNIVAGPLHLVDAAGRVAGQAAGAFRNQEGQQQMRCAMVRQYRHPIEQVTLEIPAGKLDKLPDETPEHAALRELREETGYIAQSLTSLGIVYPSPGIVDEVLHLFLARGLCKEQQELDEDEFVHCVWMSAQKLKEQILSGAITDIKTICAAARAGLLSGNLAPQEAQP